jgi:hypothetical protein
MAYNNEYFLGLLELSLELAAKRALSNAHELELRAVKILKLFLSPNNRLDTRD